MAIRVATSGWSYPTLRPGFCPEGTRPEDFLTHYASRFDTVELNTTGYRLPGEDQFRRWAEAVPDGFTFAPKLALARLDRVPVFVERVACSATGSARSASRFKRRATKACFRTSS